MLDAVKKRLGVTEYKVRINPGNCTSQKGKKESPEALFSCEKKDVSERALGQGGSLSI